MPRDEDYDDEDEDEEDEEEDDSTTLQDIKDLADTAKSVVDFGLSFKKLMEPTEPKPRNTAYLRTAAEKSRHGELGSMKKNLEKISTHQEKSGVQGKKRWAIGIMIAGIGIALTLIGIFIF